MAEKGFGVKEINLIGASGTPTITSPNNINLNAANVAISTNISIGGTMTITGSIDSVGIITARSGIDVDDFISVGSNIHLGNAGVVTATTFSGSGASLTSIPAGQLTGTVADARISTLTASKLSGALPAISGANLTNLPSPTPTTSDIQVAYELLNTSSSSNGYRISGNGTNSSTNNPDLYLIRGQKYRFINNSGGSHPFRIQSDNSSTLYSTGVTNNNASSGNIDFAPTYDSPAHLYYKCGNHPSMLGNIYLREAAGNNTNVGVTTLASSATLHTNRILPVGGAPSGGGGGIIQVVWATITSTQSVSTSTFVDILTASITPTRSDSKILVQVATAPKTSGSSSQFNFRAEIIRDSTIIMSNNETVQMNNDYAPNSIVGAYNVLDTPSTTSSVTYKFRAKEVTDGRVLYYEASNDNTGDHWQKHTITLMEVSG